MKTRSVQDAQITVKVIQAFNDITEDIFLFVNEHDGDYYPPISSRQSQEAYVQSLFDKEGRLLSCYVDGALAGIMGLRMDHPLWKYYYQFTTIDYKYRGAGIAQLLLSAAEKICREDGASQIFSRTWSTNLVSQNTMLRLGFAHIHTVTDDRGKGIHTYYFVKSLADFALEKPLSCLGIIGGMGTYATGNLITTLSSLRPRRKEQTLMPFIVMNDPSIPDRTQYILENRGHELTARINETLEMVNQNAISHLFVSCFTIHPFLKGINLADHVELIDLVTFTKKLAVMSKRKWLLVATMGTYLMNSFEDERIINPSEEQIKRVHDIIYEIKMRIPPSYYKEELVAIAKSNNCDGIILGCTELHRAFGFEKMYEGVEILDPQLDLALFLENVWVNTKRVNTTAVDI